MCRAVFPSSIGNFSLARTVDGIYTYGLLVAEESIYVVVAWARNNAMYVRSNTALWPLWRLHIPSRSRGRRLDVVCCAATSPWPKIRRKNSAQLKMALGSPAKLTMLLRSRRVNALVRLVSRRLPNCRAVAVIWPDCQVDRIRVVLTSLAGAARTARGCGVSEEVTWRAQQRGAGRRAVCMYGYV